MLCVCSEGVRLVCVLRRVVWLFYDVILGVRCVHVVGVCAVMFTVCGLALLCWCWSCGVECGARCIVVSVGVLVCRFVVLLLSLVVWLSCRCLVWWWCCVGQGV